MKNRHSRFLFADAPAKSFETHRLGEFATEQQNPKNTKHVARITLKIPSLRLCNGVSFVDTPGLGSLATSGAAETLAYLPRCDLGVVLIDAGSTLTEEDLRTIFALREAAIPAYILLSKVDLLNRQDCEKTIEYLRQHIISEIGQSLPIYSVSIRSSHSHLLNQWFEKEVLPLYSHSQELRTLSLQRKIGALRDSVISILQNTIQRTYNSSTGNKEGISEVNTRLRQAIGLIEETRRACEREIQNMGSNDSEIYFKEAVYVIDPPSQDAYSENEPNDIIRTVVLSIVQEQAKTVQVLVETLALQLQDELVKSSDEFAITDTPDKDEFLSLIRDMPVFDPGKFFVIAQKSKYAALFGKQFAEKILERHLAYTEREILWAR